MKKPLLGVVDAFSSGPFSGNPAGVLLLDGWPSDTWLQQFAAEMKHSETAFLVKKGDNHYHLRWFTPAVEMKLCGHATLASAHFLHEQGLIDPAKPMRFDSLSGELRVSVENGKLYMDFPQWQPMPSELSAEVLSALGIDEAEIVKSELGPEYLIVVDSPATVRVLTPDFQRLGQEEVHLFIVTAPGEEPYDFSSRVFAPALGIDEDPVTGSAHTLLAPYWAKRLGKEKMLALQASERGGVLHLELSGDRVRIGGDATTILTGELDIPPE